VVEQAKADGSWARLEAVEDLVMPADLQQALAKAEPALQHFMDFPRSSKRLILEWIEQARRPETRAARISETASRAANNERAHHYRQKLTPNRFGPPQVPISNNGAT